MAPSDDELLRSLGVERGGLLAGKYRIERVVAVGGMGAVLKARHQVLEQDVAVKLMRPEVAAYHENAQRFYREARAAARIASEYVARVTDVDLLDDGTPFMVMEYLEGEELARLLDREAPLAITEAVDHALQTLSALAAAHKIGIVHRDLKPSNLFVTRYGSTRKVKVLDFGISKAIKDEAPMSLKADATTAYNAVLGTPRYMSPEQTASSKEVDARTDLWSLGIVLFEALTGTYPFPAKTAQTLFVEILTAPIPRLCTLRGDAPAGLEAALNRLLERDRTDRFPSADAALAALAPFASPKVAAALA